MRQANSWFVVVHTIWGCLGREARQNRSASQHTDKRGNADVVAELKPGRP